MNRPNWKPQTGSCESNKQEKTAADGKPVALTNKERVPQVEEEPEEVAVVKEARSKSTKVFKCPKAGPRHCSPPTEHLAVEGAAAAESDAAVEKVEEEKPEELVVTEVRSKSKKVVTLSEAGPAECSPAAGHLAVVGGAAAAAATAESSGAVSGKICHPLVSDKIKCLSAQLQALVEAKVDFPQTLKHQLLVSESSKVENPFNNFVLELFSESVMCDDDGSNDLDADFGFKDEIPAELGVTVGCPKGADGIGGLVKALKCSKNLQSILLSALQTWAEAHLGSGSEGGGGLSEPEGGTSTNLLLLDQEGTGKWDELPPEILHMIFNQLTKPDLLSLSVVSKNWQKASRDILKKSRECYVYILNFTQDLPALNDMIASTNLMQVANGLHIHLRAQDNPRSDVDDDGVFSPAHYFDYYTSLDEDIWPCENIRRKLKEAKGKLPHLLSAAWSYLTLQMGDSQFWTHILSQIDALLLRELISSANQSLQKIVVGRYFDGYFLVGCGKTFPKLKVLRVQDEDPYGRREDCFIGNKFLFPCAPNLEEVRGAMWRVVKPWEVNPFVMVRIKNLNFSSYVHETGDELPESFSSVSRLHRLKLGRWMGEPIPEDIQFSMVLGSLETLEELDMETSVLYNLCKRSSREIKFPKLRGLGLESNALGTEMMVWKELPKLFPNLKQVNVCWGSRNDEEDVPGALPRQHVDHQCHVPLEVQIHSNGRRCFYEHWQFLNKVYPNITKVRLLNWQLWDDNYNMSSIFKEFKSLEYLEFTEYGPLKRFVDAFLCGINSEEADLLISARAGRMDGSSTIPPCIVPIRPSVYNAKNLLEVKITCRAEYPQAIVNQSWLIQVTENLPVRHVRHLKVTYEGREYYFSRLYGLPACTQLLRAQVIPNQAP